MYSILAKIFTIISVVIVVFTGLVLLIKYLGRNLFGISCKKRKDPGKRIIFYSGLLLISIFCLRFAVGCYGMSENTSSFDVGEEFFNSTLHALQTFSMDEDYDILMSESKAMAESVFGTSFVGVYAVYVSFLNLLAPIAGGAIVYQIISSVYPDIRLKFAFVKPCYYFSELNERSITLAESIVETKHFLFINPLIIFASTDASKEDSEELVSRAKYIGAICTKSDISEISSFSFLRKCYFLIDENKMDNIRALASLANERNYTHIKKSKVYIFCQNDSFVMTEHSIVTELDKLFKDKYKKKCLKCIEKAKYSFALSNQKSNSNEQKNKKLSNDDVKSILDALDEQGKKDLKKVCVQAENSFLSKKMPEIIRVRHYSTMIWDLLNDVPLFSPVIKRNDATTSNRDLNVSILGFGNVGSEMFLNTYWCGQMYGYNLCLNVATLEDKNTVAERIDRFAPEFFASAEDNNEVLSVYPKGSKKTAFNQKYLTFRYANADFSVCDVDDIVFKECNNKNDNSNLNDHALLDSDYFVISLGSDEMNIAVAERIARNIAAKRVRNDNGREVVIAFVVFDPDICDLLNRNNKYVSQNIKLHAFGNLRDLYSWNSVTKVRKRPFITDLANEYEDITYKEPGEFIEKNRCVYNYWSSTAREMHTKYRVFSAFNFLFDKNALGDWKSLENFDIETYKKYNSALEKGFNENPPVYGDLVKYIRWLEHRRWNAYMRSIGFHSCDVNIAKSINKDTRVALRLHACLVECKKEPTNDTTIDRLDVVSKELLENGEDYKIKDKPSCVDILTKAEKAELAKAKAEEEKAEAKKQKAEAKQKNKEKKESN